ncbi:hypothetical protein E4U21_002162 [Claviceps maximensis]|nr:hypothetical protein E4U21_002162 [Claviceps maximensis]
MARDPSRRPSSQIQPQTQTQTRTGERDGAPPDETTGLMSPGGSAHDGFWACSGPGATATGSPAGEATAEGDEPGREGSARDGDGTGVSLGWLRRVLGNLRSVELENKGSVARDHLALERTFLAWLRTSLAFASIGVAVTQLFRLNTTLSDGDGGGGGHGHGHDHAHNVTIRRLGKPLGATFLAISILTLLLGARRFFVGQAWVIRGKFPASRGTVIILAVVALAILLVSLVVVIVIHPPENDEL